MNGKSKGWAVTLLLKTKGKKRGYVERQEVALTPKEAQAKVLELLGVQDADADS